MPEPKEPNSDVFGPNAWLVDDMFDEFCRDPSSVSESWREFFEGYKPAGANLARRPVLLPNGEAAEDSELVGAAARQSRAGNGVGSATGTLLARPSAPPAPGRTTDGPEVHPGAPPAGRAGRGPGRGRCPHLQEGPGPGPRGGDKTDQAEGQPQPVERPAPPATAQGAVAGTTSPLRGSAARVVTNMTSSLAVPTATSFRVGARQASRGQPPYPQQPAGPGGHCRQG